MTATEAALFRADLDAIGYAALALVIVGLLAWAIGSAIFRNLAPRLPTRNRDEACRSKQIATLRKDADAAVASRPRVRAHGAPLASLHAESASALWLRGVCCHSADCADVHCPGRLQAQLDGEHQHSRQRGQHPPAAKVANCRQKAAIASVQRSVSATETEAQRTGT